MITAFFLLLILILLVLPIAGVTYGLMLWVRGSKGSSHSEMACGGCGYAVRGLTQLTCPECGVDLRNAGIHRGKFNGTRGAGVVLTLVCGGFLLLGCLGSVFFLMAPSAPQSRPTPVHSAPSNQALPQASPNIITPGGQGLSIPKDNKDAKNDADNQDIKDANDPEKEAALDDDQ